MSTARYEISPPPALGAEIITLRGVTSLHELRRRVCGAAVRACDVDRVLYSATDGRTWQPSHCYSRRQRDDQSAEAWINARPVIELDPRSAEYAAAHCGGGVAHGHLRADPRWLPTHAADAGAAGPYLVAALRPEGRTVGLLHADCRGKPISQSTAQSVSVFAEVFALLMECAIVRERAASRGQNPTAEFAELTTREVEVLAAMATGAANDEIARSPFISTTTVKSHVKRILRKLHARNRVGAIAHYLRYTMSDSPGPH